MMALVVMAEGETALATLVVAMAGTIAAVAMAGMIAAVAMAGMIAAAARAGMMAAAVARADGGRAGGASLDRDGSMVRWEPREGFHPKRRLMREPDCYSGRRLKM